MKQGYIFILLSNRFDEAAAAIFITSLRNAGLQTKTVGPRTSKVISRHGVAWHPDLTPNRALKLASRTKCLIIPSTLIRLEQHRYDSHFQEFVNQAAATAKNVIVGQAGTETGGNGNATFEIDPDKQRFYPEDETLIAYARHLAKTL